MSTKQRKIADDGWAVWIDGDDATTVYINDWINPKGNSYIDLAIRIRGVKSCKSLNVYVPFNVSLEEIEDVSLLFHDKKVLQAILSAACIIDYLKNKHTSEIAYNGKLVDIVHIATLDNKISELSKGTLISIDLEKLQPFLDNDEAYFIWRMPHKSLNEIFKSRTDMGNIISRLRDLITTPVVSEKFCYSVRINESRLLPEEITKIGLFHRQKLNKSVVTISVDEDYELNDAGCYRIRRLEGDLYNDYLPKKYKSDGVITYHWFQTKDDNSRGQFNFYYNIAKNSISRGSMFFYIVLLLLLGAAGEFLADFIKSLFQLF